MTPREQAEAVAAEIAKGYCRAHGTWDGLVPWASAFVAARDALLAIPGSAMHHGNSEPTPVNGTYCVILTEAQMQEVRAALAQADSLLPQGTETR